MIIDDEEPVLDSFSFIFNKYVSDFSLCGKARSGTEAVREIRDKQPDLVFMDIQMSGMDGIEVIRQVKPQFPEMIFILATAYERFDIAKKAIPLGVFSYLVKPVSRLKILEELELVKKFLDEKKKLKESHMEDEEFLEKRKEEFKKDFFSRLVWKNPSPEMWSDFCRLFHIKADRGAISLVGGNKSRSREERAGVFQEIIRRLSYKYSSVFCELGDKLVIFTAGAVDSGDLENYCATVLNSFELSFGGVFPLCELSQSFTNALEVFSDSQEESGGRHREQRRVLNIYRRIMRAQRSEGETLFQEYWIDIFTHFPFSVAKGKMVGLFSYLLHDIEDHILIESPFNIDPAEEIMPLEDMDELRRWATGSIRKFFDLLEFQRNHSYPKPLKKALSYIAENYRSQLQLTVVAEECMVSGSYLSRLFSEHLDTKFIDYVNTFRIKQAVELLKDSEITIKEAGFQVGYQDPSYFSRIFRKVMGFSPSELEKRGVL